MEMAKAGEPTRWGGYFEGLGEFDASFFSISPREAMSLDPQHRMLLECACECVESSGMNILILRTEFPDTGVYAGVATGDYHQRLEESKVDVVATGYTASTAAGRVPYALGVTGSCVSIDTACSASLVAIVYGAKYY